MSRTLGNHTRSTVTFLSLLLASGLASCAKKQEAETATPPVAAESTAAPATPTISDGNIAAIVVDADSIDIKNGMMAKKMSKNPQVKAFASQMVTDHTAVNKKATDLATKLSLLPEENDSSRQLVSNADATRQAIQAKTGAEFDKAYIDNEVAYHEAVIDMLDKTLIPNAKNAELKSLLESVKPAFEAHLDHAKKLQATLAGAKS